MGVARESSPLSGEEKRRVAYHEAGHAIVSRMLPHGDPVHKVSIIPRGMALGVTLSLPKEEKKILPKEYLRRRRYYRKSTLRTFWPLSWEVEDGHGVGDVGEGRAGHFREGREARIFG